jgi:membrane peptidoglycan carboxypeptidase
MAMMMAKVLTNGTANSAYNSVGKLPFFAAGKTGTTSEWEDAWFVGWGGGLSCAVWLGNDRDGIRMVRVTGGSVPANIWMRFMKAAAPLFAQGKTEGAIVSAPDIEKLAASLERPTRAEPEAATPDGEASPALPETDMELPPVDSPESPSATDPTPEARTEVAPASPARGETETVTICAVSGKRATLYCPKQITRTFPKGSAPKITCPLHPDPFAEH